MSLVEAIQRVHAHSVAALSAKTAMPDPKGLADAERVLLANFNKWCGANGVGACPVAPVVIAAWIRSERSIGIESERILATLTALAKQHDVSRACQSCLHICGARSLRGISRHQRGAAHLE